MSYICSEHFAQKLQSAALPCPCIAFELYGLRIKQLIAIPDLHFCSLPGLQHSLVDLGLTNRYDLSAVHRKQHLL